MLLLPQQQRDAPLISGLIISVIAVVVVLCCCGHGEGRRTDLSTVCSSIDVRNHVSRLKALTNCSKIVGSLQITLIKNRENIFENYTFPNLVEISDYFLMYDVHNIFDVGKLFPNLAVIRGHQVVNNYAMIIYKVDDLQKIGLRNLVHVGRGKIIAERCPNLCYVKTVNWTQIGAYGIDHSDGRMDCPKCPLHCANGCWNDLICQRNDHCHSECFGCTAADNSPRSCLACKNFEEDGVCVKKCSPDKYTHHNSSLCLTREQCLSILNGTQMIYKKECVSACPIFTKLNRDERECHYCPDCDIICTPPTEVNSLMDVDDLSHCSIINGTLKLSISDSFLENYLNAGFSRIREINGSLVIYRSIALKTLEFFSNLKVIRGEANNSKSFLLYDNPNLHYLWNFTKDFKIVRGNIQFYNNPNLCYPEIERILKHTRSLEKDALINMKQFNGNQGECHPLQELQFVKQQYNSTNVTIEWRPFVLENNETPFYTIYYTKNEGKNLTRPAADEDTCNAKWNSRFVQAPRVFLTNLEPYTKYVYFVKIFAGFSSKNTITYYFQTAPDDPMNPQNFTATALNHTSILLSWEKPGSVNGNFSYYIISPLWEREFVPTIEQIDYCSKKPEKKAALSTTVSKNVEELIATSTTTIAPIEICNCSAKEKEIDEENFEFVPAEQVDFDMNPICYKDCSKYMYHSSYAPELVSQVRKRRDTLPDIIYRNTQSTNYIVGNLTAFSMYIFFLRGCNDHLNNTQQLCSGVEMAFVRTGRKPSADHVNEVNTTILDVKNIRIDWARPSEINAELVAYTIELKDSERSTTSIECISRRPYQSLSQSYSLSGLSPGHYSIRITAVSLAGPGNPSEWHEFSIDSGNNWVGLVVAMIIILLVLSLATFGYWHYKRRHQFDNIHLIASINPDYAGPNYIEDEWEIDRNDVEIYREIGKGSFGLVYEGLIKSRRLPCAIKTVAESATITSKMEFLNEGSVMKSFNSGHHIVKLLGIVSRGQIPLVIMELMDCGDLKSYLKRCREPSRNLTTNEMYRMAAEIADGMAYLAAKKFVHRDLATRNCMVAADKTVKIGDFGMARDIYETDYYRKDTVGFLPVRWMAPESLADGVFTSDSDVWSYGVVLWEMATLAQLPYQGMSNEQVFQFVKTRGKLKRPPECSDLLYEVMKSCWYWCPNDRPTFSAIVHKLVNHVGEDFRCVAFCFSKEGIDHERLAGARVYNPPAMSTMLQEDERRYREINSSEDEDVHLYRDEVSDGSDEEED